MKIGSESCSSKRFGGSWTCDEGNDLQSYSKATRSPRTLGGMIEARRNTIVQKSPSLNSAEFEYV